MRFLKEGRTPYKEPRLSKSEKQLTVIIPNPEEGKEKNGFKKRGMKELGREAENRMKRSKQDETNR